MRTEGKRLTPGQGWVLAVTSVASFMVSLDTQVVATALPVIRVQLHASLAALEWTVNAYTLTFAVLLLPGAALGERLGQRRMLAVGMGLFTAASAACALAPNAGALIAARAVQGAGGALVLPLAFALLSAGFHPQRRAWAIGIFTSVTGLAVATGPVVGGAVAQGIAWPWIFWLNVPIGVILVPLVLTRLSATTRAHARLDPLGLVLATGAALGIVWALIRATSLGWSSPEIVVTLTAGAALTGVFIAWELRAAHPMMPLRLFRIRAYSAGNAACLCVFAVLFGLVFFMAQFLQTGLGYGPFGTGLRLLPGWGTLVVIAPFAGTLIRRFGERLLITGGLTAFAGALIWIALIARPGLPYADMVVPLILAGSGISVAIPPTQSVVMTAVSPADIGKASGTFNMLRQLGGVFGVAICAAIFAAYGSYASPATFTDGFGPAMGACACLALAGAIVGLAIPPRRQPVGVPSESSATRTLDTTSAQ
ncbi:DHA2 family efflux MFS transporter permease subunit [Trebonia kvetii]|uniref:DHA2 family efflux MFS transporter permease subunit n=1 Tax=Trebonia kvetii TaxID=2480626 RepID=UPI001C9E4656|nr:DHA2 family efflux MFS transporter permease subunit [Trebonia kvetii]